MNDTTKISAVFENFDQADRAIIDLRSAGVQMSAKRIYHIDPRHERSAGRREQKDLPSIGFADISNARDDSLSVASYVLPPRYALSTGNINRGQVRLDVMLPASQGILAEGIFLSSGGSSFIKS